LPSLFIRETQISKANPDSLSAGGMAKRIGINEFNAPLLAAGSFIFVLIRIVIIS
jgi:hypothetical protein